MMFKKAFALPLSLALFAPVSYADVRTPVPLQEALDHFKQILPVSRDFCAASIEQNPDGTYVIRIRQDSKDYRVSEFWINPMSPKVKAYKADGGYLVLINGSDFGVEIAPSTYDPKVYKVIGLRDKDTYICATLPVDVR